MIFLFFPNRFLNRANPKLSKIHWVFICYSALGTFRKRSIFQRFSIPKSTYFCIIFHDFSWLFRHRFSHRFFHRFLMENGPKTEPKSIRGGDHFGSLFATFSEDRFLDAFLSPFGSLWAPFWLPLAPFWLPFGSLWLPLAHFWLPLAPFGSHFCSLWLTFCSFWLTFTPFSHFGRLLASFLVPFRYFQRKSNEKSCFSMFFSEFPTFYAPASAKHLQTNRRNPSFAQLQIFAYIYLSRPGADNCRRQLRSAPGLLRCPRGVLGLVGSVPLFLCSFSSLFLPFVCFPAVYLPYRR